MVDLENYKTDKDIFNNLKEKMEKRMLNIELTFDEMNGRNKSMENWMDIYMPLRIQH